MIKRYFDYFGKFLITGMIVILAIMTAIAYITKNPEEEREVNALSAFLVSDFASTYSELEMEVKLGREYFDENEKTEFLKEIARTLEIKNLGAYKCNRKDAVTICGYSIIGEKAKVYLEFYTEEKKSSLNVLQLNQYVKIRMYVSDSIKSILYYKDKLDEHFDSNKLKNTSKISVCGEVAGILEEEKKKNIASQFIDKLGGNVVSSHIDDDNFAIYGFTKHFDDYIVYGDKKINLTLIITEDENKNVTNVYMATPTV